MTSFAPASTYFANETVSVRDMVRSGAYRSWVEIDTMAKACAAVDEVAQAIQPESGMTFGEVYRAIARRKGDSVARLARTTTWWDENCTAAARLLWQAANGRAKELGA